MPIPQHTDRTKLRIISSLVWRVREAQEIGHEIAERQEELLSYVENAFNINETHADRRRALRVIAILHMDNAIPLA